MLSERLRQMPLFRKRSEAKANAPVVIGNAVRNLVLAMRMYEVCGVMSREQIEKCVLRELERAEWMYYGLDGDSLKVLLEMEKRNEKGRAGHN